jgi:hypothetical protein
MGQADFPSISLAWEELYIAVSRTLRRVSLKLAPVMTEDDMIMEDRFNIAPRSRKLLLDVKPI